MIALIVSNAWTQLRRDRAAQILAFVVPIAFFSIFAVIFGGGGNRMNGTSRVTVAVVDEEQSAMSRALVAALEADSGLRVVTTRAVGAGGAGARTATPREPLTRETAEQMVKSGDVPAALVLPAGVGASIGSFGGAGVKAIVLNDPSDPVAARMVGGLLQRAALRAAAGVPSEAGSGGFSGLATRDAEEMMPLRFETRAVLGEKRASPMVAFYAAGIAVMFIMFSAAGAGGALIEETESGTLERVLTSGLGMTGLLFGKWLYLTTLACAQVTVMFVWGMLVFKLPLLQHLPGFILMTVCTAAAAAAFGLVLATLSRTRQQLSGLANLIVLSLNALGGSMFPRFLMSDTLQRMSLVGFNAWALDGYLKVFWREAPLAALGPQLGALLGFTALFLLLARRLARRWEAA
jgi:ABC-2 type transport system permease protein